MSLSDYLGPPALGEIVAIAGPEAVLRAVLENIDVKLEYRANRCELLLNLRDELKELVERNF